MQSYPWYINSWRGDQDVVSMTAEQRDVYRSLLDMCWNDGDLPTDEFALRKLSMADEKEWRRAWPVVRRKFIEVEGRLRNAKVDARRPEVMQAKESRRRGAEETNRIRRAQRSAHAERDAGMNGERDGQRGKNDAERCAERGKNDAERCAERDAQRTPSSVYRLPSTVSSDDEKAPRVVSPPSPSGNGNQKSPNGTRPWWAEYWPQIADWLIAVRNAAGNLQAGNSPPRVPDKAICVAIGECFETWEAFAEWAREKAVAKQGGQARSWAWFLQLAVAEGTRKVPEHAAATGGE